MKRFLQQIAALGRFPRRDVVRIAIPVVLLALIASVVTGMERPAGGTASPSPEPAARIDTRVRAQEADRLLDFDLSMLSRETAAEAPRQPVRDPFAQRSFGAAQAPAGAAPAPAAAPPLPFTYLGKVIEDGKLSVFLARGEQSYSLQAGQKRVQKLDGEYSVEKVTETSITFVYLPMKTRQTLDLPAVN